MRDFLKTIAKCAKGSIGCVLAVSVLMTMALVARGTDAQAQNSAVEGNVSVLVKGQLRSCQQMCASETEKCGSRQEAVVLPEVKERFCRTRGLGCTAACSACIDTFAECMKNGDQTVPFCQNPFNICLNKTLNAGRED